MNVLNTTGYELYNPSIIKAENCKLTDKSGKKYYDFESGVWALPLGHNNERINRVLIKQLEQISHVGYRYSHPVVEEAADVLLTIMKFHNGKCLFLSSGSEAVEFAIKLVQKISDKPYLLNLNNHYISAYGLSGDVKSEKWISIDWQANWEKDSLEILKDIPFDRISAFVFEPGNTSGTANLPPRALVTEIVARMKANQGFIVVDEVTTGMGRTGTWFGYEQYGIQPDIIACGKGLGNGYPVSAVGVSEVLASYVEQSGLLYAQSHQNDPLGCAVTKEVIAVIKEEGLLERSANLGEYLREKLKKLSLKHPCIKEVNGIGLMCSIRMESTITISQLNDIHKRMYEEGFIIGLKATWNIIRFYPPLTIEGLIIDEMLQVFDTILTNIGLE